MNDVNRGVPASKTPPPVQKPCDVDFNLIDKARSLFDQAFPIDKIPVTWKHGNRQFTIQDYLGFMLLALYVPTTDALRGLCKASELELFKERYGCPTMNLTSVSKSQAHVPDDLLLPIIAQLSEEVQAQARQTALEGNKTKRGATGPNAAQFGKFALRVVDSSVFAALPKMTWALFGAGMKRKDGKKNASVRFHVSFDPIGLCPLACAVTSAAIDEKRKWKDIRRAKSTKQKSLLTEVDIGDRNFSSNYTLLSQLTDDKYNFAVRMKEGAHLEVIEDLALSEEEKAAGIQRHAWVRLGSGKKNRKHHRIRVIWLERADKVILLATNLECEDAGACLIAEMYRERWQIELFFWWLKKIMKVGHWYAQSEKGVRIQLYLVMILALLLQLKTGSRPTKRMIELLHFYVQGMVSDKELIEGLKERSREADLARESSRKRYLAKKQAAGK